ncbi:MAG: hypothetical protein PVJ33_11010, partial [Lysobacterales bacterium]
MKLRYMLMVLAALIVSHPALAAEKLPLETFFKNSQFASFQLSPNGEELGALANVGGRMNVVVMDLKTRKPRVVTNVTTQDVNGFMWANNDRLLFFMDKDGNESFGIFAVNSDGSMLRTLVEPLAAVIKSGGRAKVRVVRVVDRLDADPEWVLVSSNERRAAYPDLFRMNIVTGRTHIVQRNPGDLVGWFTDWDGNVIGAQFQDELETGFKLLRNADEDEWETITKPRFDEP